MPTTSGTGNTAPGLTATTVLLFVWAFLTYLVRVWVRLRKSDSWGRDDSAISLSIFFVFLNVVAVCFAVHHGYGVAWEAISTDDDHLIRHSIYAQQLLYVVGIGFARASASLFTSRFLTRDQQHRRIADGITAICDIWTIVSLFTIALRRPFKQPWQTLDRSESMFIRWLCIETVGVAIDICAMTVTLYLIWTLHLSIRKRLTVSALFGCRFLVIPLIALRLVFLYPPKNIDPVLETNHKSDIVTQIVLEATFMLASITCLRPFLRPFHTGYIVTTVDPERNTSGYKKPSRAISGGNATFFELNESRSTGSSKMENGHTLHTDERKEVWSNEQDFIQSRTEPGFILRPDRCVERKTAVTGGCAGSAPYHGRDGILGLKTICVERHG